MKKEARNQRIETEKKRKKEQKTGSKGSGWFVPVTIEMPTNRTNGKGRFHPVGSQDYKVRQRKQAS